MTKKQNKPMTRQVILEDYLQLGWYHLYVVFIMELGIVAEVANMLMMVYAGSPPTLRCTSLVNHSQGDVCEMLANGSCPDLQLASDFYSVTVEWRLICCDVGYVYMIKSTQMVGVLFGAVVVGQLSDLFGRKKLYWLTTLGEITAALLSTFSSGWFTFTLFRFAIGFFLGGLLTSGYVFFVELLPQKHRLWMKTFVSWSPMIILVAIIAYFFPNWRHLTIICNCISMPVLALVLVTEESPRWLIQHGEVLRAKAALISIACRWNRQPAIDPDELDTVVWKEVQKSKRLTSICEAAPAGSTARIKTRRYALWHLFYTKQLSAYTVVLAFSWFTISTVSYGLAFNIAKLSKFEQRAIRRHKRFTKKDTVKLKKSHPEEFFTRIQADGMKGDSYKWHFRICASLVVLALDVTVKRFGRKVINTIGMAVITTSCALMVYVEINKGSGDSGRSWIRYLNLVSASMTSPVWLVVYLLSAELYPTPIRNLANGFCSMFARIGATVAPQILYLSHAWAPAPYLVLSLLAATDLILFWLVLPETKGKPLPERMPERTSKQLATSTERSNSFTLMRFDDLSSTSGSVAVLDGRN